MTDMDEQHVSPEPDGFSTFLEHISIGDTENDERAAVSRVMGFLAFAAIIAGVWSNDLAVWVKLICTGVALCIVSLIYKE